MVDFDLQYLENGRRRRRFKFVENAFLAFSNIFVNCEKLDLNALLREQLQ